MRSKPATSGGRKLLGSYRPGPEALGHGPEIFVLAPDMFQPGPETFRIGPGTFTPGPATHGLAQETLGLGPEPPSTLLHSNVPPDNISEGPTGRWCVLAGPGRRVKSGTPWTTLGRWGLSDASWKFRKALGRQNDYRLPLFDGRPAGTFPRQLIVPGE